MNYDHYKWHDQCQIILEPQGFCQILLAAIGEELGYTWIYIDGPYDYMCSNVWIDSDLPVGWHWRVQILSRTGYLHVQIARPQSGDDHTQFELHRPDLCEHVLKWQFKVASMWLRKYSSSGHLDMIPFKYLN